MVVELHRGGRRGGDIPAAVAAEVQVLQREQVVHRVCGRIAGCVRNVVHSQQLWGRGEQLFNFTCHFDSPFIPSLRDSNPRSKPHQASWVTTVSAPGARDGVGWTNCGLW